VTIFGVNVVWSIYSVFAACTLTFVFMEVLKRPPKQRKILFMAVCLLIPVTLYIVHPNFRIYSFHGFLHTGIVYSILNSGIPPENACFAGYGVNYYWPYHTFIATLISVLHLSPAWVFALVNICCLFFSMVLIIKATYIITKNELSALLGCLLALVATTFIGGPVISVAQRVLHVSLQGSGIPVLAKYLNINGMPFGLVFFTLGLFSILKVFSCEKPPRIIYLWLFLVTLMTGFFYPPIWIGWVACTYTACFVLMTMRKKEALRKSILTMCVVTLASVLVMPFLLFFSVADSNTAEVPINFSWDIYEMLLNFAQYLIPLLPLAALIAWRPKGLRERYKQTPEIILIPAAFLVALGMLFVIGILGMNGYKFRSLAFIVLGLLSAEPFKQIFLKNKTLCYVLMALLLLPAGFMISHRALHWQVVADPLVERGMYYEHANTSQNRLYKWISSETPLNSVFIDTQMSIPIFGRRSLYVGYDLREQKMREKKEVWFRRARDGWGIPVFENNGWRRGVPLAVVESRKRVVTKIYSKSILNIDQEVIDELDKISLHRPVFVVARETHIDDKLKRNNCFVHVFEVESASVWKYSTKKRSIPSSNIKNVPLLNSSLEYQ